MTMTPILVTRAYAAITETFENNLFHSVPKGCGEKEKKMAIAKLFALQVNAKTPAAYVLF